MRNQTPTRITTATTAIRNGYVPRKHQSLIHKSNTRFSVLVCHRRFGKTVGAVNEIIFDALQNKLVNPRYAYLAPWYNQAKRIAWDYFKLYARPFPGVKFNEAELRVDLPNSARIQLLGADNPDALRGIYLDGIVLDEYAQMPPGVWGEIIRPALSDRRGKALFIGTPKGHNAFYSLYTFASEDDSGLWRAGMYKASETNVISPAELEAAAKEMTPEQYEQEFECSFSAAIIGAYYGKQMSEADNEGRIGVVPHDPGLPVHTSWDLGIADATAIWFFQLGAGGQVAVIDYLEGHNVGLPDYVRELNAKPYNYGTHLAPHDARVRDYGTGLQRIETARKLGLNMVIAPSIPKADGINAVRLLLPKCYFNASKCSSGIEALRQYRAAYKDKGEVFSNTSVHDWTSHAADSFRYLAVGIDRVKNSDTLTAEEAMRMYEKYAPPPGA